jgi:hypothetical protein
MGYWQRWTGIRESPAGGGKTNLDGQFGVFSRHLRDRVDEGKVTLLMIVRHSLDFYSLSTFS